MKHIIFFLLFFCWYPKNPEAENGVDLKIETIEK